MRLGQLSRQLEVSSEQIVNLLKTHFREVNNHPNIKLTEEELRFVEDHFRPEEEVIEEPPSVQAAADTLDEPSNETQDPEEVPQVPEFVESLRPQIITLEDEFQAQTEDLETFKVEKPQLEGLKVVGKIDLPEPVIKEKEDKEAKQEKEEKRPRERRQNGRRSDRKPNRTRGNSAVAERQKAERLAKKRKIEEEQRLKELKKKHYEEKVKAKLPPSTTKKKKKKAEVADTAKVNVSLQSNVVQSQKPTAKNPLKRFWLWLNGAYDK